MDDDKVSTEFTVRSFEKDDLLHTLELCWPNIAHVLTGSDSIHAIQTGVPGPDARREVWMVETAGRLTGLAMLVVEHDELAHLKWIGLAPDVLQRRQISKVLVEHVMRDTWESGCLKLVVHTSFAPGHFIEFMHAFGFDYSRERWAGNEHVVEFYRNLYERPQAVGGPGGGDLGGRR